jgi:hypothetical protein
MKLPCANLEQLVGRYGNELAQGLLFVRAIKPRAVGTLVRLELMLSDGGPCLRAAATVSRVVEEPATAAGMELKLLAVDAEGRAILSGLNGPKLRPLKLESFGTPGSARSDPLAPSPILSLAPPAKANRPASINVPAPISPAAPAIPNAAIPLPPPAARKAAPILGLDLGGMNLRAAAMQDGRAQQIASTRRAARDESIARPLNELKELAAVRLQAVVSRAVIAVPASYRAPQREMVRMTSGLSVERIVSAPIAAALLFAHGKGLERRVLVYDLGANRFDATLVEIRGNTYEAIAIRSDETASGNTIDASLAAWLLEQFLEKHGVGLSGDPVIAERLTRAAERAKILLSEQLSAQIHEAGLISRDGTPRRPGDRPDDRALPRADALEEVRLQRSERGAADRRAEQDAAGARAAEAVLRRRTGDLDRPRAGRGPGRRAACAGDRKRLFGGAHPHRRRAVSGLAPRHASASRTRAAPGPRHADRSVPDGLRAACARAREARPRGTSRASRRRGEKGLAERDLREEEKVEATEEARATAETQRTRRTRRGEAFDLGMHVSCSTARTSPAA